jgi:tetratricopeptide (TPR) repeat protein
LPEEERAYALILRDGDSGNKKLHDAMHVILMNTLKEKLSSAIHLRETGKHEEARELLLELHSEFPNDLQVNYQCAWIHDLLGLEREAIPFYEKAIQEGLSGDDLRSALLGMGSTYRCLGEYQKARETFERALNLFPDGHEFKTFLAMTYYNLGEHSKAMELLLSSLAETSKDEGVIRYQRAIQFYADKLDETW